MPALIDLLPETKVKTGSQRLLIPVTQPIPLLPIRFARYYSYAYTVQICIYFYLRSSYLVANPLQTLLEDIVPLATSQALFCAICLPRAGNWTSGTSNAGASHSTSNVGSKRNAPTSLTGTPKKKSGPSTSGRPSSATTAKENGGSLQSRILPTILALLLAVFLPPVPLMTIALVLGAPLYPTSLLPHTLALSVQVSLIITTPLFYTHGVSPVVWREITAAWLPFDEAGVWSGTVGALIGAWAGAVPMALDWDREWQKWPCTVLWGSIVGWSIGRITTGVLKIGVGRRIDLSVPGDVLVSTSNEEASVKEE